jgi:uncharacterized protein with HEPN domain
VAYAIATTRYAWRLSHCEQATEQASNWRHPHGARVPAEQHRQAGVHPADDAPVTDDDELGALLAERHGDRVRDTAMDLLEFGRTAARLVARGKPAYDADEALQLAGEAILRRIGEAVARLPDSFTSDHPVIEWRKMKQMRNIVAHDYARVDHEIVWTALEGKMPDLTAYVERLLLRP